MPAARETGPAAPPASDLGVCPIATSPGLAVTRFEPPGEAIESALRLARAASIDVGGIEYLVGKADGRIYFYDVNATSNFVANAPEVLGFDPFPLFVDFIVRRATGRARRGARRRGPSKARRAFAAV